ncbi:SUMF1/EgtB/PvdO family nonheme iron enzyme [Actibacterium sp. 188UL27-1]|uniref:formylglycine-generating enzyme family protein n=1 Tax=Actibacterium sp. 188UL27-1 TaxID=2786961 RepID=UPI00195BCE8C|nr:SUMF1/EgtB/PvdO family nonheme iron enzyme [Actibacterium sp. 188UL27-1]MBM7067246.1 SUMF1/EgtB/PvdO family nonheme iron enzyme [Actibacterium sp. 188UL27-1]
MWKYFAALTAICIATTRPALAQEGTGDEVSDCQTCPTLTVMADGSAMGTYPVTVAEFTAFAEATDVSGTENCYIRVAKRFRNEAGFGWANPGFEQGPNHPVVCINWMEAVAYADWLSAQTGKPYRLPTYEESVATTAAGAETAFWWGDDFTEVCERTNAADAQYRAAYPEDPRKMVTCDDGYEYTSPVDAFPPNPLGLHDVAGNVWQWTNSCLKGDCSNAIFRGAAWTVPNPKHFRNDGQWADRIVLRNSAVGFRVMRDAE